MSFLDDVNRILRDHEGYTGPDGQYPLPIGNWTTARKPIDKRDLRQLFSIFDESATAAQGIIDAAGPVAIMAERVAMDTSVTVTVGASGDFPTISAALADLSTRVSRLYTSAGVTATVQLLADYTMAEQVLVRGGMDLGWITIISDAVEVPVSHSSITQSLSSEDAVRPIFGAINNSVLPRIGALFAYADKTTAQDGVAVISGSRVEILPGCGVKRARNGLKVLYGSQAHCYVPGLTQGGDGVGGGTTRGAIFSDAANRACHIGYGSQAYLPRSDLSGAGEMGVYCVWGSRGDFYQSTVANSGGWGFYCRDGSTLCARETNASYCVRGYHALHQGRIDARSRQDHAPSNIWIGEGARHCTEYAVLASGCSQIEADELKADFCTGNAAVHASNGSTVNFGYGTATGCTSRGVWAVDGGTVSAQFTDVGGCNIGYHAQNGGMITCGGGKSNSCIAFGILAESGSSISAMGSEARGAPRNVESRNGCDVDVRNAILTGATERGVSAIDGGRINCMGAQIGSGPTISITARDGAYVAASNADCGSGSVQVTNGSTIAFSGGAGALSQTANTATANGIIYR